jgi:hypothetical protein
MIATAINSTPSASDQGGPGVALTPQELLLVDTITNRIAGLLDAIPARASLVDAATAASALGVSRDYVYAHADELGGKRVGDGPRGRLRFDLDQAVASWTSRSTSKESQGPEPPAAMGGSPGRRHRRLGSRPELLPIRGPVADIHADMEVS